MTIRDRIVVGGLAFLVAVAGFWFLALKPKRAEVTAAQQRASAAQTQLQSATDALATATTAKASFEADYATIAKLGKAVPDDDDSASLVFQIETAARKAGIDFRSLTVGGTAAPAATTTTTTPPDTAASAGSTTTPAPSSTTSTDAGTGLPPGVVAGAPVPPSVSERKSMPAWRAAASIWKTSDAESSSSGTALPSFAIVA
jgi:type II secretory pathway pseudopilin PulG